jgi:hypothetical protein
MTGIQGTRPSPRGSFWKRHGLSAARSVAFLFMQIKETRRALSLQQHKSQQTKGVQHEKSC